MHEALVGGKQWTDRGWIQFSLIMELYDNWPVLVNHVPSPRFKLLHVVWVLSWLRKRLHVPNYFTTFSLIWSIIAGNPQENLHGCDKINKGKWNGMMLNVGYKIKETYIKLETGWFKSWMLIGWQLWCATGVTKHLFYSNYLGNKFIIAIRHLGDLWYMTNIPRLRAVSRPSALRCV